MGSQLELFLILSLTTLVNSVERVTKSHKKCCANDEIFDDNLTCTNNWSTQVRWRSSSLDNESKVFSCDEMPRTAPSFQLWNHDLLMGNLTGINYCLDVSVNGSIMIQMCLPETKVTSGCDSVLTTIRFWGADIAMHMNITHVVLCVFVVLLYLAFYDIGRRTYNRAVLIHNACLLCMGCTLTVLGVFTLCHHELHHIVAVLLWLTLQFFTLASTFWLNVICFDMTLVITQFRWLVGSFDNSAREENRRFHMYGIFAWGSAVIPTLLAGIMEICAVGSVSPVLRADYTKYHDGPNTTVNLYFFLLPLITLFFNNILFVYTSYKIFVIQRSTAIVNKNQSNVLWKKYFLFLRLYLLMGAPWFFGMLMACMNQLWILKTCRIAQPILWILMLVTHKKIRTRIADKLGFSRSDNQSLENSLENRRY
ncbi:G-protein coupled receptor Mth2-like [Athalia rosae]|uniref:G-protein coupled receptor Mth2-like n=1 Tax=Athalia rosae TaxID=37344 RepID=UPI002033EDCB|nr:G-protein coupled receptor Mth2-like [Athalia rosae]XP_048505147.1 G-protein coupled receptor Mth2-like [Athalia rosae]